MSRRRSPSSSPRRTWHQAASSTATRHRSGIALARGSTSRWRPSGARATAPFPVSHCARRESDRSVGHRVTHDRREKPVCLRRGDRVSRNAPSCTSVDPVLTSTPHSSDLDVARREQGRGGWTGFAAPLHAPAQLDLVLGGLRLSDRVKTLRMACEQRELG
jgi:hypothetical protein